MKFKNQNLKVLLLFVVMLFFSLNLYKVNAGVSSSDPTTTSGGTATITLSSSPAAQSYKITLSDNGGLTFKSATSTAGEVNGSTVNGSSASGVTTLATYTFSVPEVTATTKYTVKFTVQASSNGETYDIVNGETNTSTVTVKPASSSSSSSSSSSTPATTSATAAAPTLTNLGINPYDFSGFSASKTSYSVTVPNNCSSVTIYATAASGVSITGTGTVTLKEGTNKYSVTASNSNGSTTYTLSIIRKSEEEEIIPNVIDEEESESEGGIGLDSLKITGYELDDEFALNKYEYTIYVGEKITEELLEEIKSKIFWTSNYEDANVEYELEVVDDEKGIITLIVNDAEREYSRYTINVVYETDEEDEEEALIVGTTTNTNEPSDPEGGAGLWETLSSIPGRVWGIIGIILFITGIAVYLAVSSYVKYKKYEQPNQDENYNFDENPDGENTIEEIANERENSGIQEGMDFADEDIPNAVKEMKNMDETNNNENIDNVNNNIDNNDKETEELKDVGKSNPIDLAKDSREKMSNLGGYRNLRKGFGGAGKH